MSTEIHNFNFHHSNQTTQGEAKIDKKNTEKEIKEENNDQGIPKSVQSSSSDDPAPTSGDHCSSPSSAVEPNINLSRDELLKLLSVFEGELQARDEVISILKTECSQSADMRYGLTCQPLKALQRDAATLDVTSQEHVCEQTKEQLKKIIQHQKQSYSKLKQMHLAAEEKNQQLATDLEGEKKKHQEFMLKSDDFVNLIEHDRERLKQMLEQEKANSARKERGLTRMLKDNKEEVVRLKSLSLELVEDRQRQLQLKAEQAQTISSLEKRVEEMQQKLQEAENTVQSERDHARQLENDLEDQGNSFYKEQEAMNLQLTEEKAKTKELEEKVKSLGRQMQKLKSVDKNLRKTDDQLWRIQEKLEQEEKYEDLLEEVELLRKTVAGMQEAEKIYAQAQEDCKDLRESLDKELTQTKVLREEVERLRKSSRNKKEMDRCIEEALFRFDEMQQLYKAEYKKQSHMKKQLEEYRLQLQKIDESESLMKLNERKMQQMLVTIREVRDEKVDLEAKLQMEKEKSAQYEEMIEDERTKVTEISQKVIDESKKLLKAKQQLATLATKHLEEKQLLIEKVESAEEVIGQMITQEQADQLDKVNSNLRKQVTMLKKRLDKLEVESDDQAHEVKVAKEEAENAKRNFKISTEHLKRLVALGLGEHVNAIKLKEDHKLKTREVKKSKLYDEVSALEMELKQGKVGNANNNNGVAVTHAATQTCADSLQETAGVSLRQRVSRSSTTSSADSKPPSSRRASSLSRREVSSERSRAPFKVGIPITRRSTSTSSTKRVKDEDSLTSNENVEKSTSRAKTLKDTAPSTDSTAETKKGLQFRTVNQSSASRSPSSPTVPGRSSTRNVTPQKAAPKPPPGGSSVRAIFLTRNRSKTAEATKADRSTSSSPTNIPKFRSVTLTSNSSIAVRSSRDLNDKR